MGPHIRRIGCERGSMVLQIAHGLELLHGPESDTQEVELAPHQSGQNEVVAANYFSPRPET